jgi:glycosyltransferase involved in cell wall biosynthesis
MPRPRIALVTFFWPLPGAPHAGKPIYETALRLADQAEVGVFCPVASYLRLRWLQPVRHVYHRADPRHITEGVAAQVLEYRTLPGLGRPFNGLLTQSVLEPALRAWRPDLILAYWLYPTAWAAVRVGRRLGVPVVVGSRGSDLHRIPDAFTGRMTSTALRDADEVLTVTEDLRRMAIGLGASPERTHSVPNGCDARVYHPMDRLEARRALGVPEHGTLLLQVGHLLESKGVLDLVDAFASLASQQTDLQLALVGDGPAEGTIRERAAGAGLTARLLMPGARPMAEVALWMNAADVVCLASHGEGCPNVVIEALSCGRPVVGVSAGGIPELIREGCGLIAPVRNPPALAGAVQRALAATWDSAAISSTFSRTWDDVARETFAICESCLARYQAK